MLRWTLGLSGTRDEPPSPGRLHAEADRIRAILGDGAVDWALEVGDDMAMRVSQKMPVLSKGASPLEAVRIATTATALQALTQVAEIGEPGSSTLVSNQVKEISVELAGRGMELHDVMRGIRIGYAVLAEAFLDAATRLVQPDESSAELRRISALLFEELDNFADVATSAFLEEQNIWAAGVSAGRLDLITRIIDGEPVNPAHAEQVLGYQLDKFHLALIAWTGPNSKRDLRTVVDPILRRWGSPTATLVIPVGLQVIWAWGAFATNPTRPPHGSVPDLREASVVVGELRSGLEGLRDSHLEARAVERLVRMKPGDRPTIAAHEDVALEVLLLSDADAATRFVARVLGPLADSGARTADLRSTLRRYLDFDHSLAKVAAAEHISKNTVTYRVQKALALCAYSVDSTTDLRAAFLIHDWLQANPPAIS